MLAALRERLSTQLPRTVAGAIVVVSLVLLGFVIWRWQHDLGTPSAALTRSGAGTAEQVDPLPVILSGNVFGSSTQAGDGTSTGTAREATGYNLRAAFAGTEGSGGAIIEPNGGEARWYASGETLADGATLREVHADHVILERNGAMERLEFQRLADMPTTVAANTAPAAGSSPDTTIESGRAEPIPADAAPDEKARLIRQRLEELRNRSRT